MADGLTNAESRRLNALHLAHEVERGNFTEADKDYPGRVLKTAKVFLAFLEGKSA